jgi:hypothetical protein
MRVANDLPSAGYVGDVLMGQKSLSAGSGLTQPFISAKRMDNCIHP